MFQALKESNLKLSFKTDRETKYFHNKEHLKKFMTTVITLQKFFKDILERDNGTNSAERMHQAGEQVSRRERKRFHQENNAVTGTSQ